MNLVSIFWGMIDNIQNIIYFTLFLCIFIWQIYLLVSAIKKNNTKTWITLFLAIILLLPLIIFIIIFNTFNRTKLELNTFFQYAFYICIGSIVIDIIMLLISTLVFIVRHKYKKEEDIKKNLFKILLIILIVLIVSIILVITLKNKNINENIDIEVQELYEYGEYIESMDIPPNTIVARFNGEEILFHEIESYRNSIKQAGIGSKGKSAFYEVVTRKLYSYLAKEYPNESNYNLNIEDNLSKTKKEWLNGYGEYSIEESRKRWLKTLFIEKDEIWLNEEDFITYLQNMSVEYMLSTKGSNILSDFVLKRPELANDKELENKVKQLNDMQESRKELSNETDTNKRKEIMKSTKDFSKLYSEAKELYIKDLILNSELELCIDQKELSHTVPEIYLINN